jgi:ribosome biogenesis GTPase A
MSETKKSSKKELEKGWYNCTVIATGEKKAYYSSTINALSGKGILEVGNYIKDYFSPTMKR